MQQLSRHWLLFLCLALGLFVLGAVAAPTLMALGLEWPGRALYALYGLTCHQLPQRSYFLFGPRLVQTYSWDQLLAAGMDPLWPRQFLGTPEMGYKLALAHRNTAIYVSLLLGSSVFGLVTRLRGRQTLHVPRWALLAPWLLAVVFMALDGGSHLVSELSGSDFRAQNGWLHVLTGGALPAHVYVGDGIGSFNWLMRSVTGSLVGLTSAWLLLPTLRAGFERRPKTPERGKAAQPPRTPRDSESRWSVPSDSMTRAQAPKSHATPRRTQTSSSTQVLAEAPFRQVDASATTSAIPQPCDHGVSGRQMNRIEREVQSSGSHTQSGVKQGGRFRH